MPTIRLSSCRKFAHHPARQGIFIDFLRNDAGAVQCFGKRRKGEELSRLVNIGQGADAECVARANQALRVPVPAREREIAEHLGPEPDGPERSNAARSSASSVFGASPPSLPASATGSSSRTSAAIIERAVSGNAARSAARGKIEDGKPTGPSRHRRNEGRSARQIHLRRHGPQKVFGRVCAVQMKYAADQPHRHSHILADEAENAVWPSGPSSI